MAWRQSRGVGGDTDTLPHLQPVLDGGVQHHEIGQEDSQIGDGAPGCSLSDADGKLVNYG